MISPVEQRLENAKPIENLNQENMFLRWVVTTTAETNDMTCDTIKAPVYWGVTGSGSA